MDEKVLATALMKSDCDVAASRPLEWLPRRVRMPLEATITWRDTSSLCDEGTRPENSAQNERSVIERNEEARQGDASPAALLEY